MCGIVCRLSVSVASLRIAGTAFEAKAVVVLNGNEGYQRRIGVLEGIRMAADILRKTCQEYDAQ